MPLTATVSNTGGLGSSGANDLALEHFQQYRPDSGANRQKPSSVNLWVSTFDDGEDVLYDATYARLLKILSLYHIELGLTPPPKPNKNCPHL
ncbi:MAG: hypothetical protein M3251_01130 [Thermoproteota archaeon]|nr:hypothetical protein [Thermoproteota archaeon]